MAPLSTLATALAHLAVAAIQLAEAASCPTNSTMVSKPVMYNLHPSQSNFSEAAATYIQIQRENNQSTVEQAAVFKGIPAEAKTCTLGWRQAAISERHFVVNNSGLVAVIPLQGFPNTSQPISYAAVKPYEDASTARPLHPDFTSWDKIETAESHIAGDIPCAKEIYLHLSLDPRNGDGHVFLDQDDKNGFTISYVC